MSRLFNILVIGAMLVAVVWLITERMTPRADRHPAVGNPAPEITLVELIPGVDPPGEDDEALLQPPQLSTLPAGKVTLLHFWGTWCPPCRLEYPELVELAHDLAGEPDFLFLSVSCGDDDYRSLREETQEYYRSLGAEGLQTYADLDGFTRQSTGDRLGQSVVYPTTVLISDGEIAGVWLGYSEEGVDHMRQAIRRRLGG